MNRHPLQAKHAPRRLSTETPACARQAAPGLDPERLAALLSPAARAWRIETVEETGSTNADLLACLRAARAAPCADAAARMLPTVRLAYRQTAGRGRRGRPWLARRGDALLFSLACVMPHPATRLAGLSLAVGVAVLKGLLSLLPDGCETGKRLALKWPNDILLDEAKLGGSLIETAWSNHEATALVIGIGLNLAGAEALIARLDALPGQLLAAARPAVLSSVLPEVGMSEILAALLNALARALQCFSSEGFAPFREPWCRMHAHSGRRVRLMEGERELTEGIALGVDESGQLLLDTPQGVRVIASGDISLRAAS